VHLPSKRGIEYFQLSMFPTNRGIWFSFKANPNRCNMREGFWAGITNGMVRRFYRANGAVILIGA
jgi:hypothetical protein